MGIPFVFNPYSSLLLPAFIHGLLFSGLSFARFFKERRPYDLLFALLLLLLSARLSFWMLGFAGWYDGHDGYTTFMFYFPFNTLLWIGPCLFFYFLSLTNRDFKLSARYWPHFILPALLLILYGGKFLIDFLVYRPFPDTEQFQYATRGPFAEWDKSEALYMVSYASLLFYFWLILRRFKDYRAYLVQHFSEPETVDLAWLRGSLIFMGALILVMLVFYIVGHFTVHPFYAVNWYPYFFLGIVIYYTSVNGYYNSPDLFKYLQFGQIDAGKESKSGILPDLDLWKSSLQQLMEIEQPYLDPELTLSLLARKLHTHPQIVSKVINDGFGLNFSDYINSMRVEAVIRQFGDKAHHRYSLMGVAYDCGFNSKTTFNRAFKKVTGDTPAAYIRLIEGSNDHLNP